MDNKKRMKIGLIVLILLLLVGIVVYSWRRNSNQQAGTKTENVNTQTLAATVPEESKISLTDKGFEPSDIEVKVGMAVRWVNNSSTDEASVNSNDHPTNKLYPQLNLGQFKKDSSVVLIFDKAGKYGYHNYFKPTQKGTVTVTE